MIDLNHYLAHSLTNNDLTMCVEDYSADDRAFPAHIRVESEKIDVQSVNQHCRNTAEYAAEALCEIGLERTGFLLGLIHDLGKMTHSFSDYLWRAARGESVKKGSVNHTFAAVKLIFNRYHGPNCDSFQKLDAELLAFAVGAHHGLFDCMGPDRKNGFLHRLKSENDLFTEASTNYFMKCCPLCDLDKLFAESCKELTPILTRTIEKAGRDQSGNELCFCFSMLSRLLLSALIDGDRRDTAEFMNDEAILAGKRMATGIWNNCLSEVEKRLLSLPTETKIQQARAILSKKCRDQAILPAGIYRLNLPTGAGKTLSSLRFALAHAAKHGKSRIIFTSPLLSILEQNAEVIREYLNNDDLILEHHSNIVHAEDTPDTLSPQELLVENWDSPIIITTLVQFLNTLFSGETSSIRRFHSLCNSIIIIDEVQTVPLKLLSMFQLAASFLTEICGATILLCSATQPPQEYTDHPFFSEPIELIPRDEELWKVFRRTVLQEAKSCALDEIPRFAAHVIENTDSLLIICNKKDEASTILQAMRSVDANCFHLSAAMCAAHRNETLNALKASLNQHETTRRKTVCVSTQVIEAGVDISFGSVIRLAAGMDNVVQAAGRCNRNGESDSPTPAYILNCRDESLKHLLEIQQAKDATLALLAEYRNNKYAFREDLSSPEAIRRYYQFLYDSFPVGVLDFPTKEHGTIFDLLSGNKTYYTEYAEAYGEFILNQAFKTAGKDFCVFDTQTDSVIVPYREGAEIICQLRFLGDRLDPLAQQERRKLLQLAKPYTVTVYDYQAKQLEQQGAIDRICNGSIMVLQPNYFGEIQYSDMTGLITKER